MLAILSPVFDNGAPIPIEYTCEGRDISPPLQWAGVDRNARSLVLIVDDPDAPDPAAPKMTWVHWIVYDIPPSVTGLPADVDHHDLPRGGKEGLNSWDRTRYGGPCPPIGRHRYFFKLYALDKTLSFSGLPDKDAVLAAMEGHVLQHAQLMGTYQKQG